MTHRVQDRKSDSFQSRGEICPFRLCFILVCITLVFVAFSVLPVAARDSTQTVTTTATTIPATTAATAVPPPVTSFNGTPTSGTAPLTVRFVDTSSNWPTWWRWDFGDGNTSFDQNPLYTYVFAGTYSVSLTAANPGGGSNLARQVDYITVIPAEYPPVISFTADPASGTAPLTVRFTDTSTNSPTSWSWNFGEGGTSQEKNPTYTYSNSGIYPVYLTATNGGGSNRSARAFNIVVWEELPPKTTRTVISTPAPAPVLPGLSFTGSPVYGPVPLDVRFTAETTGAPSEWRWDFGDGESSTARNPSHTYEIPGTYTVILMAKFPEGTRTSTKTDFITAESPPAPTQSPLSPFTAFGAFGIMGIVSIRIIGRKR
jgi:PKD repeat protein